MAIYFSALKSLHIIVKIQPNLMYVLVKGKLCITITTNTWDETHMISFYN